MATASHFGVYGLWRHSGKLVLVRKARGPYTGLLDLPGGSPEPGESPEETLARELLEETGVQLFSSGEPRPFEIRVSRDSEGRPVDMRHRGLILEVEVEGEPNLDIIDEDVRGVVLAERVPTSALSPLTLEALQHFPSYADGVLTGTGTPRIDTVADAAYFPLVPLIGHGECTNNVVIERPEGTIVLDVDADGHLLGVEVIGARALLRSATIEGLEQIG